MKNYSAPITILIIASLALFLFWHFFNRYIYQPGTRPGSAGLKKEPFYSPHLLQAGLLAAGGGLVFYIIIAWLCRNL